MKLQVLKIRDYRDKDEQLDLSFNLYVSEEWLSNQALEPYQIVIVGNEIDRLPLTLITSNLLRGYQCVVSKMAAEILQVSEGSYLSCSFETLPHIDRVIIEPVEPNVRSSVSPREVISFFSRKLRFAGLKDNVVLSCKDRLYRLRLAGPGVKLQYGLIGAATRFHVTKEFLAKIEKIVGLSSTVEAIREVLLWPVLFSDHFKKMNLEQPRGILLSGVPGVGKTHLVKELAKSTGYQFFYIRGPEFLSKYYGASEKNLRSLFEAAIKAAPAIIFFDEIDSIGSKRTDSGQPQRRLVSQLLTCMEQTVGKSVIVFGATNHVQMIDPALRRPGRFDMEFVLKPPDVNARAQMIKLFSDCDTDMSDEQINSLARRTDGYVGADLSMLSKEAKLNVIRRCLDTQLDNNLSEDPSPNMKLTLQDYEVALSRVKPSLLRGYNTNANVKLENIRGYEALKKRIFTEITHPVIYSSFYDQSALKKIKGILLYGEPGTGKTSLAQAIANELGYNFIGISASQLSNKFVGETEASIRDIFAKARYASPCVVFLDEVESIMGSRSLANQNRSITSHETSVVGQLLSEMDGLASNDQVIVIGATNEPKMIDRAFLRPNRFDLLLEVPLPNTSECEEILVYYLRKVKKGTSLTDDIIKNYALKFKNNGFSGADIQAVVRAAMSQCIARSPPGQLAERHHKKEPLELETIDLQKSYQQHLAQRNLKSTFRNTSALV